jgi:hypothetical protein
MASARSRCRSPNWLPDGTPAGLGAASVRRWEVEHARGAPPLALRVELGEFLEDHGQGYVLRVPSAFRRRPPTLG